MLENVVCQKHENGRTERIFYSYSRVKLFETVNKNIKNIYSSHEDSFGERPAGRHAVVSY